MRISLLEKREDFYQILSDTLINWNSPSQQVKNEQSAFIVNRFLNFIAHPQLPTNVFTNLAKEYSTSPVFWKNLIQRYYVRLAVNKNTRRFLSHKRVFLPVHLTQFLILGGNHRLRLFKTNLKSSYVILKRGESQAFIKNELLLKKQMRLDYAPRLITSGANWFEEEYIDGTPLNRLSCTTLKNSLIDQIISSHFQQLLLPSQQQLSADLYVNEKREKLLLLLNQEGLNINEQTKYAITQTHDMLCQRLNQKGAITITWTHGDFQKGNVLVESNVFKVIDWEAADKRFWLYDFFVFLSGIRSNGNFEQSIRMFEPMKKNRENTMSIPVDWKTLLMIEELYFSVKENCSPNFFRSGEQTLQLCNQIKSFLTA